MLFVLFQELLAELDLGLLVAGCDVVVVQHLLDGVLHVVLGVLEVLRSVLVVDPGAVAFVTLPVRHDGTALFDGIRREPAGPMACRRADHTVGDHSVGMVRDL